MTETTEIDEARFLLASLIEEKGTTLLVAEKRVHGARVFLIRDFDFYRADETHVARITATDIDGRDFVADLTPEHVKGLNPAYSVRTVGDMIDVLDETVGLDTYDTATPRQYWDLTNDGELFVWSYDTRAGLSGRPRPLTKAAREKLKRYVSRREIDWPTDDVVLERVEGRYYRMIA